MRGQHDAKVASRVNANHLLVLQLFGDVPRTASRNLNPSLGKERTGCDNKGDIESGVNGINEGFFDSVRWGNVVGKTGYSTELGRVFSRLCGHVISGSRARIRHID